MSRYSFLTSLTTTYRLKSTAEPMSGNFIASFFDTVSTCDSSGDICDIRSERWQPVHTRSGAMMSRCRYGCTRKNCGTTSIATMTT